jgi:hypothetical protein
VWDKTAEEEMCDYLRIDLELVDLQEYRNGLKYGLKKFIEDEVDENGKPRTKEWLKKHGMKIYMKVMQKSCPW